MWGHGNGVVAGAGCEDAGFRDVIKNSKLVAERFFGVLGENPVVPAVRGPGVALERVLGGRYPAVFVLGGDVFELLRKVRDRERRPFICVNVDMVGGVAADASGLRFLSRGVDGIISTHRHVIELAKGAGFLTIQRLFAIDSGAVERGVKLIRHANPDGIEILPGVAYPEVVARYRESLTQPTLAGGLITDRETIKHILDAGAAGVSTSTPSLWNST